MKRTVLAGLAAATLVANYASAADIPRKAPPPPVPAPVYAWTGCYIGANVGWARAKTEVDFEGVEVFSRSADGIAGGGQVGCDYQFASNWVIGIQGMVDGTGIEAERVSVVDPTLNLRARVRGFATITGRVGYTITPAFLLYGKFGWGGYRTRLTINDIPSGVELASASRTQTGLDLGIGGEWMFAPNWSLWIEWDRIFPQDKTFFFPNIGGGTNAEVRRELDKVLVGVNWRFGGAAPIAARY
jgi:outer membrane immunogenic protein